MPEDAHPQRSSLYIGFRAGCKPVGNVDGTEGNPQPTPENVLHQIQNKTIGLGGNVVFLTTPLANQGVAYHCN